MKVWIDEGDGWPTYTLTTEGSRWRQEVDVDEVTLTRWREVLEKYETVQREMATAYSGQQ